MVAPSPQAGSSPVTFGHARAPLLFLLFSLLPNAPDAGLSEPRLKLLSVRADNNLNSGELCPKSREAG